MIGRVIGNYKIEAKLGEGGMGAVYKGIDTMLDREVAIKALRQELASQTSVVERFRKEAVTLAKLHHPNIATLYSLFRQTDELYMVLEYVRGETLDSIMQRRGALPADEVIPVFCQILDGINHAHEYGIIHRDIKPANMMLTEKGTLKVLDFGIARLLGSNRMTRAGNVIGTLEYMAPEQVKGQETDARTDIYALGMMLYEMLTGRTPFESENEFELMKLQIEAMPLPPRALNFSIPQEVENAIMRAIRKNPDERFQTAGEFRETLLDAGYAAQGKMRRITGSQNPQIFTNSELSISVSKPGNNLLTEDLIKETRLGGEYSTDAVDNRTIRETGFQSVENVSRSDESPATSLFSNLNWMHYAAAGSAGVLILGLLIIIPLVLFSSGTDTPAKAQQGKLDGGNTALENKAPKTEKISFVKTNQPEMVTELSPVNPFLLLVEISRSGEVSLNSQEMGQVNDPTALAGNLTRIFSERKEGQMFKSGMEQRSDLPIDERIEKTVYVKIKYDDGSMTEALTESPDIKRIINAITAAGASPIKILKGSGRDETASADVVTPRRTEPSYDANSNTANTIVSPPSFDSNANVIMSNTYTESPRSEQPKRSSTASRTVTNNPPPRPAVKSTTVRNTGSGTKSKAETRCALTGDC